MGDLPHAEFATLLNSLGDYELQKLEFATENELLIVLEGSHRTVRLRCQYFYNLKVDFEATSLCATPFSWGSEYKQLEDGKHSLYLDFRGDVCGLISLNAFEIAVTVEQP